MRSVHPARTLAAAALLFAGAICCGAGLTGSGDRQTSTLLVRGRPLTLRTYGSPDGDPVVVSSGDGGWIHVAPHVAELLASHHCFVVGVDVREYLEQFTTPQSGLRAEDVPADYREIVEYASRASGRKPVLVGVSEGAGLDVLAETDAATRARTSGVVALGLPNTNELGWRWRDATIYLTHRVPNEPTFRTDQIIGRISPTPLAAIQSTHDEFVPRDELDAILAKANEPKRVWFVEAADHRFSDNLAGLDARLLEAVAWVRQQATR